MLKIVWIVHKLTWVDLISHISMIIGHNLSKIWTNTKMTFVLTYSFKTPQVLGEFSAIILENNVRENIGSFIFTKGKT